MVHGGWRQIGAADIGQGRTGAGVLLGVVIFPFNANGPVKAHAVQLDHDFLDAVGVAGRAGGDKVPAVEAMSHGPVSTQQAGAGVLADDLHALDVGAVDAVAERANELHHGHALPFHVRAVQVETGDVGIAGPVEGGQVIGRRFDV